MSVVERARIVRVPTEAQMERALIGLLEAPDVRLGIGRSAASGSRAVGRLRFARRRSRRGEPGETVPMVSEPLTEPAHDALRVPASPADDTPAATPPETR